METWKDVVGYEGRYLVSNTGFIKSLPKPKCKREKLLIPCISKTGYHMVDLGDGVSIKRHLVHRIVATAFHQNPYNKPQVNHKDGNKANNAESNLEWNTQSENQLHSISIGLRSTIGEKNSQSKLSSEDVLKILNDKRMYKYIAPEYNISIFTVSDIKRGYSWTHITGLPNTKKNRKQVFNIG